MRLFWFICFITIIIIIFVVVVAKSEPLIFTTTPNSNSNRYRAPELVLLQEYGTAVDVWSAGCIFAELLGMQIENVKNYRDRVALFPGE